MATFRRSINLLPKETAEEMQQKARISKTTVYAAFLPLVASLIWVVAVLIGSYYKGEVAKVDQTISNKEQQIDTYLSIRQRQTELVLKVEALKEFVTRDFFPQKFFDDVSRTIRSTGDAQAEIYAYTREKDGKFGIEGKANSYLDLAKIMVVFSTKEEFIDVNITSISYNRGEDNVNFEITFYYAQIEES